MHNTDTTPSSPPSDDPVERAFPPHPAQLRCRIDGWAFSAAGEIGFPTLIGGPMVPITCYGRSCLDWSERQEHLGGPLGNAILAALVNSGLAKIGPRRLVKLTASGHVGLGTLLSGT
jgi:hypothetical protein